MNPFGYNSGYRSQGRGCGPRLFGALFIAVLAIFMYMTNTQTNPVTGEKQRVAISPEQEVRLGIQAAPQMSAQMGGELPDTDPRVKEVQRVGNKIIQQSRAHKGPWRFQFHVLADSKTVNAFALPGGQIFITLGLLNKFQNEAQLAGVLAHEIGHVIQRHAAEQMAKGQLGQMLVMAAQVGASDSGQSGYGAAMIANVVNQMLQLRYSRGDELEADQWGIMLMSDSGYNPTAMLEVMAILKEAGGKGRGPEMLLTHPYPENRIEQIKEYLKQNPPNPSLTEGKTYHR